jgi:hypothetical protein
MTNRIVMVLAAMCCTIFLTIGQAAAAPPGAGQSCCKMCSKGKACGNSCISAKATCHKSKGCACNAK